MQIFNFKKFNESISEPVVLTEGHRLILDELIEDLWTLEIENMDEFRRPSVPDLSMNNICLRSSIQFKPGDVASLVDHRLAPDLIQYKNNIYGFLIRTREKHKNLLNRALELFRRETGIKLATLDNEERQTIISEPKVIEFIEKILEFENSWEELPYMLPDKYNLDVELLVEPSELEIHIHFPSQNRQSNIIGCYLDLKISRGLVVGGDLPLADTIKYKVTIDQLRNFQEKRDNQSILQFAKSHKGEEYQFEFDIDDIEESNQELIKFIEKKILSQIELTDTNLKSEVEFQIKKLKQWSIKSSIKYLKVNLIEVQLDWKGGQYEFYLHLNNSDQGLISIKQDDNLIDESSTKDLAENIYLSLVENKLKIVQ